MGNFGSSSSTRTSNVLVLQNLSNLVLVTSDQKELQLTEVEQIAELVEGDRNACSVDTNSSKKSALSRCLTGERATYSVFKWLLCY